MKGLCSFAEVKTASRSKYLSTVPASCELETLISEILNSDRSLLSYTTRARGSDPACAHISTLYLLGWAMNWRNRASNCLFLSSEPTWRNTGYSEKKCLLPTFDFFNARVPLRRFGRY